MFGEFDPNASVAAVCGVLSVAVGAWVAVKIKKLEIAAQKAKEAAERAERAAARATEVVTFLIPRGPTW